MICPQCNAEYREGYTICGDCQIPLVRPDLGSRLSAESESSELEAVFQTESPLMLEKIVSMLETRKIPYLVQAGTALRFQRTGKLQWEAVLHVAQQHAEAVDTLIEELSQDEQRSNTGECPYCKNLLEPSEDIIECEKCHTRHHLDCWHEKEGCSVYGCSGQLGGSELAH